MSKVVNAIVVVSSLFFSNLARANEGIDATINSVLSPISDIVAGTVFYSFSIAGADIKIIVLWLIAGAVFCTFYFNFINRGVNIKCEFIFSYHT